MNFEQKKQLLLNTRNLEATVIVTNQMSLAILNDYARHLESSHGIPISDTQVRIINATWDNLKDHEKTYLQQ